MSNPSRNAREESKRLHDQRQHLALMKREETLIQLEHQKLAQNRLTETEIAQLKNREALLATQRRLHAISEYGQAGGAAGGYFQPSSDSLDASLQNESSANDLSDLRRGLRDDRNWSNEHLSGILNQNNLGGTEGGKNTGQSDQNDQNEGQSVFSKINLVLHKQSEMVGNNTADNLTNLDGLSEADKERILEARREKEELAKLSEIEQIQYKRRKLPAYLYRDRLLKAVAENQVLIVEGETGSGKTTQIMQFLYEAGYCDEGKIVACTQPRRVAATSVAARVAVEKGVKLGEEVGYNVRFDNCSGDKTRIKYLTEGMLLRELLTDSDLSRYSVIMIDEAHERTISTDILLGILKSLLKKRSDLKIIIASATINIDKFSKFFAIPKKDLTAEGISLGPLAAGPQPLLGPVKGVQGAQSDDRNDQNPQNDQNDQNGQNLQQLDQKLDPNSIASALTAPHSSRPQLTSLVTPAPTFKIPGRTCNIDIYYTQHAEADYVEAAILTIMQIHSSQPLNGDILVFLPGQEEIQNTNDVLVEKYTQSLKSNPKMPTLMICPIYANLPAEEQAKIFHPTPPGSRKVVLATNIAETSLTIDGIVYVIDSGWCKTKLANSSGNSGIGMEALVTTPISKASANQRAGRAGRIRDGKCFRLFTYDSYLELDDQNIPEIQRSNLCDVILLLKALGINRFVDFDWIDPPSVQALNQSISLLYALGAIAPDGRLTQVGYKMTILPVEPMMAKMLLKSEQYQVTHACIKIAALLSVGGSILHQPNNKNFALVQQAAKAHGHFFNPLGDHFTLLNIYEAYCEQIQLQNQTVKEIEDSLVMSPSHLKLQELARVKKSVQGWCLENFLQFKMLQKVDDIAAQLVKVCTDIKIPVKEFDKQHVEKMKKFGDGNGLTPGQQLERETYIKDYEKRIRLAVLHGFFPNIAKLTGGAAAKGGPGVSAGATAHYSLLKNLSQGVHIHPQSCLYRPSNKELRDKQRREASAVADGNGAEPGLLDGVEKMGPPPQYILYHELMQTKREYLRGCMVIEKDWIGAVAPHFYPDEARMLMQQQQGCKLNRR